MEDKSNNTNKDKKLRILMLNYEFPPLGGGASPVSYEIAKAYAKLGHQVDVVTMHFKGLEMQEKKDNINIYRVKCLRSKKEICHPWEQYTYIKSAKKFLKQHLKDKPKDYYDINHTHFIIPTGVISLWLKKNYKIPYIITSHGSDVLGYNNKRAFKYIYPFIKKQWIEIVKQAKCIVTPSKFLQNKIKEITTEGNFAVISNGINKDEFKPQGNNKKENRILIVARLFENKGVQDIIQALSDNELKQELEKQKYKIIIVGEGPYKNHLISLTKKNNLDNIIEFKGWLDNKSPELKSLYAKSKIFISASHFENLSIVLLEALASGCIVLASNVGGNPEVITNKQSLFEKQNITELKSKIEQAINNKLKPLELNSKFEWNNIIQDYVKVLR